jgi:hypothetical protein
VLSHQFFSGEVGWQYLPQAAPPRLAGSHLRTSLGEMRRLNPVTIPERALSRTLPFVLEKHETDFLYFADLL